MYEMKRASLAARMLAIATSAVFASSASAFLVPGGGPATSDCYVELDVDGITAANITSGKKVTCVDGDPCDQGPCNDDKCTFGTAVCINQTDPNLGSCVAPAFLSKLSANGMNVPLPSPLTLSGPVCGDGVDAEVSVKKPGTNKEKPGKLKIKLKAKAGTTAKPKSDTDNVQLICAPRTTECPATTTTVPQGSTTTTTLPAGCCGQAQFLQFTTKAGGGDCGDVIGVQGTKFTDVECGGLYFGGGGNGVPLPGKVPDQGKAISKIESCTGQTATVGAALQSEVGVRNCTEAGCLFGAPLAVPNPGSTPTSTCVINQIAANVSGTVACDTGVSTLQAPLSSIVFLTGDADGANAGIQPCPLCQGGSCIGGPNNGQPCTPGTSDLGDEYPTSHDCPPDPMLDIGTLPISFTLSSGTISWTATTATNDSETEANQSRVFSGFCRDTDITGTFLAPARLCWENGMAVGAPCAQPEETCEQRTFGAFGPGGGGNMTITAIGSAGSLLGGPADGTLVSVFSIPPTNDATVNQAGDLPGPGAVALPGTAALCADAMSCP